jgi:hypothetical protein
MKLSVEHQKSYSRGQLLLRGFLGWFYIGIPHIFVLVQFEACSAILHFYTFWSIIFRGTFPKSWYDFQVKVLEWSMRYHSSMINLIDGYPEIGVFGKSTKVKLEVPYPKHFSKGSVLLRAFFGFIYVAIPHYFCLFFVGIWSLILGFLAWWVVLFTGEYPENWHSFQVGVMRWAIRVKLYLGFYTDEYPPFSTKE